LRRIVDVPIPRPRTLGHTAYLEEVARCSAELHELLLAPDGPPLAPETAATPQSEPSRARERVGP
jgi:NitT/TauT family transport system ATP-binding protein